MREPKAKQMVEDTDSIKTICEYIEENLFSFISNVDFSVDMYEGLTIIGKGAGILNGLSYEPIEGNVTVLTEVPEMHGFNSGFCRTLYLKGYSKEFGFDGSNIASAERVICDYIKYKDVLDYYEVFEFVENYGDENDWDFSKVYDMAEKLGVSKESLDSLIDSVLNTLGE